MAIFKNKKNNVAFVDIRNRKKYVQGFAFGAINCPLERFSKTIDDLVPDKSTYLILIGTNVASVKKTILFLSKKKYSNLLFIKNGGWKFTCLRTPEEL